MRRRRSLRRPAAALLAGALLLACSGNDDDALGRSPDAPGTDESSTSVSIPAADPVPASAGVLRIGLTGIDTIDPAGASPAAVAQVALVDLFYDGLTALDDDGQVVPGLAEFSLSDDGTVWRFTIRDDATFADGSPVTAADVVFSLQRIQARAEQSLAALRLDQVVGIAAVDERVVEIRVDGPSAVLPELLSSPLYAVTHQDTMATYLGGGDQTPNASGDYSVTIETDRRIVLERRQGSGPVTVVVDLFDDDSAALDAFLDGSLDWVTAPPDRLGEAVAFAGEEGLVPFHGSLFLGVDAEVPPLEHGPLRRAIALAIDRRALVDAVFGPTAQPLLGVIPAGIPGAATECLEPCGAKVEEARQLVELVFPDGQEQPLRLLIDDSAAQTAVAGVLEDQLTGVGLDVAVSTQEVETYEELVEAGQQQLFVFGSLGVGRSPASHLPPLFESTSADNVIGLDDPAVDAALSAARAERNPGARIQGWRSVEQTVLDRVPVVPLVQFRTTGVMSPRVSGLVVHADGSFDLRNVSFDDAGEG